MVILLFANLQFGVQRPSQAAHNSGQYFDGRPQKHPASKAGCVALYEALKGLCLAPTWPSPMRYSGLITRPTEGVKLLPVIEITWGQNKNNN